MIHWCNTIDNGSLQTKTNSVCNTFHVRTIELAQKFM